MAKYEVYYHPIRKFSTIKRGFIWPAFFFGPIWLFYRKCWGVAAVSTAVVFVWSIIVGVPIAFAMAPPAGGGINDNRVFILSSLLAGWWPYLAIGFLGSKAVVHNLKSRGFVLVGKYKCKTGDAALALLHKNKAKKAKT